jgi:hypothetical protein
MYSGFVDTLQPHHPTQGLMIRLELGSGLSIIAEIPLSFPNNARVKVAADRCNLMIEYVSISFHVNH